MLSDDKSLVTVTSDIIVVALDTELTCKQLGQWHGQPALLSGAPEHQPIALCDEEFKAWGIVTHTSIIAVTEAE